MSITWDKRDRNGRIIGWVMVDDGIWVNKVMVLTGMAWWYERYAPDEVQLREAQEDAREAKRGLWAEAMAVAPWDWRNWGNGVKRKVLKSQNLIRMSYSAWIAKNDPWVGLCLRLRQHNGNYRARATKSSIEHKYTTKP